MHLAPTFALALGLVSFASGCFVQSSSSDVRTLDGGIAYRYDSFSTAGSDCVLASRNRSERVSHLAGGTYDGDENLWLSTRQMDDDTFALQVFTTVEYGNWGAPSSARNVVEERRYSWSFTSNGARDGFDVDYRGQLISIDVGGVPAGATCAYAF